MKKVIGFISLSVLSFFNIAAAANSKKTIIVDLSDQKAYMYQNNKLIWTSAVFTGRLNSETPEGTFTIFNKAQNIYFNCDPGQPARWVINGIKKCYFSKYWLGFTRLDGTVGLHDANWWRPDQWKNRVYLNRQKGVGSHGCVNVMNNMSFLFNTANVGDIVKVQK